MAKLAWLQQMPAPVHTVSHTSLQVQHERRVTGEWRIDSGGLFGGAQTLRFDAGRKYAQGELVTLDFGPGKLDSQLLLDYGVLNTAQPQVLCFKPVMYAYLHQNPHLQLVPRVQHQVVVNKNFKSGSLVLSLHACLGLM